MQPQYRLHRLVHLYSFSARLLTVLQAAYPSTSLQVGFSPQMPGIFSLVSLLVVVPGVVVLSGILSLVELLLL